LKQYLPTVADKLSSKDPDYKPFDDVNEDDEKAVPHSIINVDDAKITKQDSEHFC